MVQKFLVGEAPQKYVVSYHVTTVATIDTIDYVTGIGNRISPCTKITGTQCYDFCACVEP